MLKIGADGRGRMGALWTTDHKDGRLKGFDGRLMIVWKEVNGRKYCPHQQWLARKMNLARLEFLDPEKECSSFLKLSKGWF